MPSAVNYHHLSNGLDCCQLNPENTLWEVLRIHFGEVMLTAGRGTLKCVLIKDYHPLCPITVRFEETRLSDGHSRSLASSHMCNGGY